MKQLHLRIWLVLGITAVFLSGCVSGPRFADTPIPPQSPDKGRIYFYRDGYDVAFKPEVMLNGNRVGKSVPGGFFYVDQPSGNYLVFCHTVLTKSLTFSLSPGEERYVHMRFGMTGTLESVTPFLEERQQAMKTLRKCKYTGD